jgi:hypothetical protein
MVVRSATALTHTPPAAHSAATTSADSSSSDTCHPHSLAHALKRTCKDASTPTPPHPTARTYCYSTQSAHTTGAIAPPSRHNASCNRWPVPAQTWARPGCRRGPVPAADVGPSRLQTWASPGCRRGPVPAADVGQSRLQTWASPGAKGRCRSQRGIRRPYGSAARHSRENVNLPHKLDSARELVHVRVRACL